MYLIIVPYAKRWNLCEDSLRWVVNRIQSLVSNFDHRIIVIENSKEPKGNVGCDVEWETLQGDFIKSWACNFGTRQFDADVSHYVFIDSDLILPDFCFERMSRAIRSGYKAGSLIGGMLNLDWKISRSLYEQDASKLLGEYGGILGTMRRGPGSGTIFVERDFFDELRGFNEAMCLSCEDAEIFYRARHLGPWFFDTSVIGWHFYHPRSSESDQDDRLPGYPIASWVKGLDKAGVEDYISKLPKNIGQKNEPNGYQPPTETLTQFHELSQYGRKFDMQSTFVTPVYQLPAFELETQGPRII